jgi:glutathione synthase
MSLRVAVQMDPIEHINIKSDTSFALMLEAQRRGHTLYTYTPHELSMEDGVVKARVSPVTVQDKAGDHARKGPEQTIELADMDIVLLRQDPPYDMAYLTTTYLLERLPRTTLVVNDPRHVRDCPEKVFVTLFPDLMAPTLISRDPEAVASFHEKHGDIVIKPLYGNGGRDIFLIRAGDPNFTPLLEVFAKMGREPWVTQAYLPAVKQGDKRIILINGEPVISMNRIPAEHAIRSNLARGGSGEIVPLTDRDREICARIGPSLKERGQIFVGIDVIGNVITEINNTSPTGLRKIRELMGHDFTINIWDAMEGELEARRS